MSGIRKVNDLVGQFGNPDAYLTNYSYALMQDDASFVAGVASSQVSVEQEAGKYNVYNPGYFWRDEAKVRPLGGRPVQVAYGLDEDTYYAEEWALEHTIDDRQRRNVRGDRQINLDENATRLLTGKQMIRADRLWADAFFKDGVWAMQVSGVAADPDEDADEFLQWGDAASNPINDIEEFKERIRAATGMEPNTLVLGANVRKRLKNHPDFIERVKYTSSAAITNAVMAALFEVENVRVARALYNAAAERMPGDNKGGRDLRYIVDPNSAWLGYIDPNPTVNSPTAIANFAWTGLVPGQTNDFGGVMSRGRDGRAYTDWFHNRQAFGLKKVSDDLAVFIKDAVAG
ncbi:MAG: hypothetical protein ACJ8DZ_14075 [Allosphingosinicella sp.]